MREWREEERKRLEMEERVRKRKEERSKTVFDRVKERFAKATDGMRKSAEAMAEGLKEGKNIKDIAKKLKKELTPEETAMQKARRERLARQRKEQAALERKALFGDQAAKDLLQERKLQRFSYSVMSNQKWAFNLQVRNNQACRRTSSPARIRFLRSYNCDAPRNLLAPALHFRLPTHPLLYPLTGYYGHQNDCGSRGGPENAG